jgi:hypothetical protein
MALDATAPRSRRALLAAAAAGLAAFAGSALGRPAETRAAAGDNLKIGSANDAGASQTTMTASAVGAAFTLKDSAAAGTGIFGWSSGLTGAGRALYGRVDSPDGFALQARQNAATGTGAAVQAIGGNNSGVVASSTGTGSRRAALASATQLTGTALEADGGFYGIGVLAYGGNAVQGNSATEGFAAVIGRHTAATGPNYGVYGEVDSTDLDASGVYGTSSYGYGVHGIGSGGTGVLAEGVTGLAGYGEYGVYGETVDHIGVWGAATGGGLAVYGSGNGQVSGSFSKASGTFKIDHPLDPSRKYLQHSFVESPDMKNVYDGLVALDSDGKATVTLPSYFSTLNRDTRIQLTAIGSGAPALHVSGVVTDGRFSIAGGEPGQRVYWQVTGIRKDPWAEAHPVVVELTKTTAERGTYLHPELYGQPREKGVDWARRPARPSPPSAARNPFV